MELIIKSLNETSKVYRSIEFVLNDTLIADFFPIQKKISIYDAENVRTTKCASFSSAMNQVVKFHKKNF